MLHPFEVSIVSGNSQNVVQKIIVAKRGTRERAEQQAAALRKAIGTYNRDGVPQVVITDLRMAGAIIDTPTSSREEYRMGDDD